MKKLLLMENYFMSMGYTGNVSVFCLNYFVKLFLKKKRNRNNRVHRKRKCEVFEKLHWPNFIYTLSNKFKENVTV